MLFKVPVPYTVKGTPKGKRNPVEVRHWEYVEVDVPVMADENAPVSLLWDDSLPSLPIRDLHAREEYEKAARIPEDGINMMRYKDGEHFLRRADRLTPEGLAAKLEAPKKNFSLFKQDHIFHYQPEEESPVDPDSYRQDKDFTSDLGEKINVVREAAERLFIVGDDIFELSSEPVVISVGYHTQDDQYAIVPRIMPVDTVQKRTQSFNIHRYADVVDNINESQATGFRRGPFRDRPEATMERAPEILIPEAFRYDDAAENFVNSVRNFLERESDRTRLISVNPYYGIAYLQLKIALDKYDLTGDTDAMEEWAGVLTEQHPEDVRHCSLPQTWRAFCDRPVEAHVDTISSGLRL